MTKEVFRTIPAYPRYEVSDQGRVRNKRKGNILSYIDNGKGYKSVKLYSEAKPKGRLCLVHRLVASTFNPVKDSKLDVNHLDGNKANNALSNLEWCSHSENIRHAHYTGLFRSRDKLSVEDVLNIKQRIEKEKHETYASIAKDYGVKQSVINKIALGQLYDYV